MLSGMIGSVVDALREKGIDARRRFGAQYIDELGGVTVFVGAESAACAAAGFGSYIGRRAREDGGGAELYGMRCDVTLALDICARAQTEHCEDRCAGAFDEVVAALSGIGGLAVTAVRLGRGGTDCGGEIYRCPGFVECSVLLVADEQDGTAFTDFILKGVLER